MARLHQYALLTPWYARQRTKSTATDEPSRYPVIQKYVTTDFVERLVADPQDSIRFDPDEDVWSYTVPRTVVPGETPSRRTLSTRVRVPTALRKLYQPSHDRFYAVLVELFCDEPGFPRLSSVDGLEVGFVVRRIRTSVDGAQRDVRALATAVLRDQPLASRPAHGNGDVGDRLEDFERAHKELLGKVALVTSVEAWRIGANGRGAWRPLEPPVSVPNGGDEPSDEGVEEELAMWRIPPPADVCERAQTRSLWFGVVPTYSSELDEATGQPKFDDQEAYVLRCFVRERPAPGQEHCPPRVWWSDASEPYRLAAFFDPGGTKNHRVRVKLPDLQALEAAAGEPLAAGGVEFERPPASQLRFGPVGKIPTSGSVGGTSPEICTFAIQLITIVATFVFSIFLPIVVIVFQLWWLLALRFCLPPKAVAFEALSAYLAVAANSLPIAAGAARDDLGEMFGLGDDDGSALVAGFDGDAAAARTQLVTLVDALENPETPTTDEPEPEPTFPDPLCEVGP
jgi:hypothetical protein